MLKKKSYQLAKQYRPYVQRFNSHPYALPVTTFMVLFFLAISIFVGMNATNVPPSDVHSVILSVDGTKQTIPTRAPTVGEFVKRAGIKLNPNDRVEPDANTPILYDDFKVNIYRARPVTIIDEGKRIQAYSAATTPRSVAQQAGIQVFPEDRLVSVAPESFLRDGSLGQEVIIDRATPVNLVLYGSPQPTRTRAKTVEELLKRIGVKLGPDDQVSPALPTLITPNMTVSVIRNGIQIATVQENIAMPVQVIEDSSLSFGAQAVRQQGSPGKKTVTYEINVQNGIEVSRRKIQEVTIVPPVPQIVARGPSGSFGQALAQLRQCEAGGNYGNKNNPSYRGAYQFGYGTWNNYGGYYDPADAPPAIQDQKATETYKARGWQPWPTCSVKLGLQDAYR